MLKKIMLQMKSILKLIKIIGTFFLLIFCNDCKMAAEKATDSVIEDIIDEMIHEGDLNFDENDYEDALYNYENALSDLQILIGEIDDSEDLYTYSLDSAELVNKIEITKIALFKNYNIE